MAGIKISALPAVSAAALTDIFPVVQTGITRKETLQQVLALFNTNIQLASSAQVTGLDAQLATYLPLAGGTMAGPLILNTNSPTVPLEAASKGYVDTVASGFTVILACQLATTGNLNTTYANGASGIGAQLTDASGTFAPFSVDGVSPAVSTRILVKNQTTTFQNGVYVLTTNGDGISVPYVLTRATDYDQPSEIQPGTLIAVNAGTVNSTTSWLETATVTTVGTDPILFSQFTFAPSAFLQVANNLSDVANVATSRANLGLGTAATKAASDNTKPVVASVTGSFTVGHLAVFADTAGTVEDGGPITSLSLNDCTDGRLTLTSGIPVTTSDVTAATTIYYTPYIGNSISLYDGAVWNIRTFTQLSIAVPGTTNTMYDVFCYDNSGTPTLELQAWTNDTTRATGIARQDGVLVKSGALTRRYLGSFGTGTVSGQTEDSISKRWLYNYYNREIRPLAVLGAGTWSYATNALRQANGSAANQLGIVQGVSEDTIYAQVIATVTSSTPVNVAVGIGIDSTTVNSANIFGSGNLPFAGGYAQSPTAEYTGFVTAGRHAITWLERGGGAGAQTWFGVNGNYFQSGITGWIRA